MAANGRVWKRALAVLVAAAVVLSGCSWNRSDTSSSKASDPASATPSVSATGPASPTAAAGLARYTTQEVAWRDAGNGIERATIKVPIDYENPDGGDTEVALVRVKSAPGSDRWLFTNPGGPGASGVQVTPVIAALAGMLTPELTKTYNLIGFDPRGVGASDPLVCGTTAQTDAAIADAAPLTAQNQTEWDEQNDALAERCERSNQAQAAHVTTIETARDMDVIRQLIGQEKLDYLGYSYGTYLGTTYAALFPDKVGQMVLDGAVDPNLSPMQASLGQTFGFETAFQAWAENCVASKSGCPVGSSPEAITQAVIDLIARVDATPLPTKDPQRPLGSSGAFYGIANALYAQESWDDLTSALTNALRGDGTALQALADDYFQRGQNGYEANLFQANAVINSLDCQYQPQAEVDAAAFRAASPTFGEISYRLAASSADGCASYPLRTTLTAPDYSAPGAPPILVIGTTRDPATPLANAKALASTLSSGVLLTRDGDGHTAYLQDNACINTTVTDFLVKNTVPADGTAC